jgi:hypothetical protein
LGRYETDQVIRQSEIAIELGFDRIHAENVDVVACGNPAARLSSDHLDILMLSEHVHDDVKYLFPNPSRSAAI